MLTGEALPTPPATARAERHAHAAWCVVSAGMPGMTLGYIAEFSPTRLPEPTRNLSPMAEIDTLRRALLAGSIAHLPGFRLPWILGWLKGLLPLSVAWLLDDSEYVISVGLPGFTVGTSKTRPLPL